MNYGIFFAFNEFYNLILFSLGIVRSIREIKGKELILRETVEMRTTEANYLVQHLLEFEEAKIRLNYFSNCLQVENFYAIMNGSWKSYKQDKYFELSFEQYKKLKQLQKKYSASIAKESS